MDNIPRRCARAASNLPVLRHGRDVVRDAFGARYARLAAQAMRPRRAPRRGAARALRSQLLPSGRVLRQPNEAVLRWLADRDDALVNVLHPAVDYIFADAVDLERLKEIFDRCQVRRWHGKNQQVRFHHGTRYDGGRWSAPNLLTNYADKPCRLRPAKSIAFTSSGAPAAPTPAAAPASRVQLDLVGFDHRSFWQSRLLLIDIDPERLGRTLRNQRDGTRSRVPLTVQYRLTSDTPASNAHSHTRPRTRTSTSTAVSVTQSSTDMTRTNKCSTAFAVSVTWTASSPGWRASTCYRSSLRWA